MQEAEEEAAIDEVVTEGAAPVEPAAVKFDWRTRSADAIWPGSRFAMEPPRRRDQCAFPSCAAQHRLRFACKRCEAAVYCSKPCRTSGEGMHNLVCDLNARPEEVELFLHDLINKKRYAVWTELARDVCTTTFAAADMENYRILPEGREAIDLVKDDFPSDEAFLREYMFTFAERVHRILEQCRHDSFERREQPPSQSSIPATSPSSDSPFVGLHLFAASVVMLTHNASVPLAMLVSLMWRASLAAAFRGFSFFTLEAGQISPGMTETLTFQTLYEQDARDARMGPVYLICLTPLDPAAAVPHTALLWRVGHVAHLHQALRGHYCLGDWMRRLKSGCIDVSGYAAKPMTQRTVVKEYIKDLMLLSDEYASAADRRAAFCRALGIGPRSLRLDPLNIKADEEKSFPIYKLAVCRAFVY